MEATEQDSVEPNIGEQIFAQANRLVSEEGLSRTEAFQRIADESGRRPGTVAANYYRIARKEGAPLQARRPRGSKAKAANGRRTRGGRGSSDAGEALSRAMDALQALATVVRDQEKELATLRSQAEQLTKIQGLLRRL